MRTLNVVFLSYGLPCLAAYGLAVVALWRIRRRLSNSFVAIYITMAIVNLLTYLNSYVNYRFRDESFMYPYFDWLMMEGHEVLR